MPLSNWLDCSDFSYILAFLSFQDSWFLAEDETFELRKSNQKKEEHLAFEEMCVAFRHFHPSEDGSIPSLLKKNTPSGFYEQWLIHLHFLQWGRSCSTRIEQTNWLQHADIAEAAPLYYLTIFLCETILIMHIPLFRL